MREWYRILIECFMVWRICSQKQSKELFRQNRTTIFKHSIGCWDIFSRNQAKYAIYCNVSLCTILMTILLFRQYIYIYWNSKHEHLKSFFSMYSRVLFFLTPNFFIMLIISVCELKKAVTLEQVHLVLNLSDHPIFII